MGCRPTIIQGFFRRFYYRLGKFIYRNPASFLIVPFFLTILAAQKFENRESVNPTEMIIIQKGKVQAALDRSRTAFGAAGLHLSPGTFLAEPKRKKRDVEDLGDVHKRVKRDTVSRDTFAMILTKDRSNIFTRQYFDQVKIIHQKMVDLIGPERCIDCAGTPLLELDDIIDLVESHKFNLTWPGFLHPYEYKPYLLAGLVGSPNISEDGNRLLSATGLLLIYKLHGPHLGYLDDAEKAVMYYTEDLEKEFPEMTVAAYGEFAGVLDRDSKVDMVAGAMPYAILATLVISIGSSWTWDPVKLKVFPQLLAVVYSLMAGITAMGFLQYIGVEWLVLNLGTLFFILGVGIDDTFVMLSAWRNTDPKLSGEERMGLVFAEAAVAITVTSLTDSVSFWMGTYTPLKFCKIFCTYAGMGMTVLYFYQISMFGATLAIFGRLEEKNRHFLGCCKLPLRDEATETKGMMRICCTGGEGRSAGSKQHQPLTGKIFQRYWGPFLQKTPVKIVAIIIYLVYASGAVYYLLQMKINTSIDLLYNQKTPWYRMTRLTEEEMGYLGPRFQVAIYGNLDYSNPRIQQDLENLMQDLEAHPWIGESIYTDSWLRGFLSFVELNSEFISMNISTEEEFVTTLKEFYAVNPDVNQNLKFSEDGKHIIASRFFFQTIALGVPPSDLVYLPTRIQEILDKYAAYDLEPYEARFFWYEKDLILPAYSLQALGMAAVAMLTIAIIFIPSLTVSFWIALTMVSIEVGVAGYLVPFGGNFDLITVIALLMCIGFCVDFASHISYAFSTSEYETPGAKMNDALGRLGWPILQAAVTTISGTAPLIFLPTYPCKILGLSAVFIMLFGLYHGLVMLPILLEWSARVTDWIGSKGGARHKVTFNEAKKNNNLQQGQDDLHHSYGVSFLQNNLAFVDDQGESRMNLQNNESNRRSVQVSYRRTGSGCGEEEVAVGWVPDGEYRRKMTEDDANRWHPAKAAPRPPPPPPPEPKPMEMKVKISHGRSHSLPVNPPIAELSEPSTGSEEDYDGQEEVESTSGTSNGNIDVSDFASVDDVVADDSKRQEGSEMGSRSRFSSGESLCL